MAGTNMTVGKRIAAGFSIVLLCLVVSVVLTYMGVGNIVGDAEEVIHGNKLDAELAQREVDHLNWAGQVSTFLNDANVNELKVQLDHTKCGFGKWLYGEPRQAAQRLVPQLAPLLKEIEKPHAALHASAVKIKEQYRKVDVELGNFLREMKTAHLAWAHRVKDVFVDHSLNEFKNVQIDPHKCTLGLWLYGPKVAEMKKNDPAFAAQVEPIYGPHQKLHESAAQMSQMLAAGQRDQARAYYMANTKPLAYETLGALDGVLKWHDGQVNACLASQKTYVTQTVPALTQTQGLLHQIRATAKDNIMTDQSMLAGAQGLKRNVSLMGGVALVLGVLLAFFLTRGITHVLQKLSGQMGQGASQVNAAAEEVASSSQSLAEGSAQQAASLEETSASLEEMASMTRQNAESARQANELMAMSRQAVGDAETSMGRLKETMDRITAASDETAKIIKTIDEIAFQTNLLALNAAVEAARAGDAGAGFAVVADEVRNLAMRAAEAAKNTTTLIEGNLADIRQGSQMAGETNRSFSQVAERSAKVAELVAGIDAATTEQSQGIAQINQVISEMDKVTQTTAAGAEEAASAAEEMNAQAEALREMVDEMARLAGRLREQRPRGPRVAGLLPRPGKAARPARLPQSDPGDF